MSYASPKKEAFLVRTEKCLLNKKFPRIFQNKEIGKLLNHMEKEIKLISMFGQKRLSREGGIEIVVKELCTRMAQRWA